MAMPHFVRPETHGTVEIVRSGPPRDGDGQDIRVYLSILTLTIVVSAVFALVVGVLL